MECMANEYRPSRILLTGGAGFIGSHVATYLVQQNYNVVVYDKLSYCSSLHNLDAVKNSPRFKFIQGDILSTDLVRYVLQSENIDTIMHFAAETHVDHSFGNSIEFTKNNVLGTHVLLEAAKEKGIRRFIHVSTDEVYGETLEESAREETVLLPTNPYAASKAGAELLVRSYYKSFQLPIIITRGNNVYGPGQYPEKVIPKFMCRLIRGEKLPVHGNGQNSRSYLYILDVVRAFHLILTRGEVGQVYNIGTSRDISNLQLAHQLLKMMCPDNNPQDYIDYVKDRAFNDRRYHIDYTPLRKLGWEETVSFSEGLRRTMEWYFNHLDYWKDLNTALTAHSSRSF